MDQRPSCKAPLELKTARVTFRILAAYTRSVVNEKAPTFVPDYYPHSCKGCTVLQHDIYYMDIEQEFILLLDSFLHHEFFKVVICDSGDRAVAFC